MSKAEADAMAVDRVLGGDTTAFEVIVRNWQGPLVNLAYRFCRDRGRAEDMAQDAFLRAFRGLKSWRRDASFSTWLFALATNVYRTEMRRIPPRTVPFDELLIPGHSQDAFGSDRRQVVIAFLQSMPSKYRDPLLLFYFHEQDVATTARACGCPKGPLRRDSPGDARCSRRNWKGSCDAR